MSDWKLIKSEIVHKNPWYQVRKDAVIKDDGKEGEFYIIDTPGPGVFIIAMTDQDEIYLIKQYRYQTGLWSWEVPGGNGGSESPKVAAMRELQEETGLSATSFEEIGTFQAMNGCMSEISHIVMAKGLTHGETDHGDEEVISRVKKFSIPAILQLITAGELSDGQSISALMQTLLHLGYTVQK